MPAFLHGGLLFLYWHIMISLGKGSWMGMEHALFFALLVCIDCSLLF